MNICTDAIREVLAGDVKELISAFVWDETPQGHDFWWKQCEELTDEGREILEQMLTEAENEA